MQLRKSTEQIADRIATFGGLAFVCLVLSGCSVRDTNEGDSPVPEVPDLPKESVVYEGILDGILFNYTDVTFQECNSGEVFNLYWHMWEYLYQGSCIGVYTRIRGQLDRSLEPPGLLIEEILEARWSRPSDCGFYIKPYYDSCYLEEGVDAGMDHPANSCLPVELGCGESRCMPVRFEATEFAGWKHFECDGYGHPSTAGPGQACEYSGDLDNCLESLRCWNPEGDITKPGVCVPYCDLSGKTGPACDGTCVRCSSSDVWGLCMTDCSGEDCNVDEFC